jgi:prevent-host-death family protein
MREAEAQLTQLAERAWHGDKVVITKAGKPYVDLLPHVDSARPRKPGRLKGEIRMAADFDISIVANRYIYIRGDWLVDL